MHLKLGVEHHKRLIHPVYRHLSIYWFLHHSLVYYHIIMLQVCLWKHMCPVCHNLHIL